MSTKKLVSIRRHVTLSVGCHRWLGVVASSKSSKSKWRWKLRNETKIPFFIDRGGRKSSFKSTTGDCYHGEVVFVSDTFDDGSTSIHEPDSFRASVRFAPQERKLLSRLRLSRVERGPNDSNVKTEMAYSRETENSPPPNRLKRIHSMKSSHRIGEKVWSS